MPKQSRFLCIGGFLNGTQVKDQGDSFVCVENGKQVTYHKKRNLPSRCLGSRLLCL